MDVVTTAILKHGKDVKDRLANAVNDHMFKDKMAAENSESIIEGEQGTY